MGRGRGHFSVEIEDHVLFLHLGKDRVKRLVIENPGRRVLVGFSLELVCTSSPWELTVVTPAG